MNARSWLLSGLVALCIVAGASTPVQTDPNCEKECGAGNEGNLTTRSGCTGEGGTCFVTQCPIALCGAGDAHNDDCFSWLLCRPVG